VRTGDTDIFAFYLGTKVIHGAHSIQQTGIEFKGLKGTKALVVTDKGVRNAGLVEAVTESLQRNGISYTVFDDVEEDPGVATVAKGVDLALSENCDGIVVVGGGSPICAGRAIAVVVTNGGEIRDYVGLNKAGKPPLPLVAIPTTAGSGAEVSQFILLKDEELHTKMVAGSPLYFPRVAILDPLLLKGLSFHQFVASGVDALGHAIEGYLTTMTTPITDALSLQAVGMLYHNLRAAATSDDIDAKEACLIASSMANIACGNSRLGLVHAMSNPVEGMFKVPHGISVGILLPHVMEFNLPASHARFAALAKAMGEGGAGRSPEELAPRAIVALKRLLVDLDFPKKYSEPELDRGAIPRMAVLAMGGQFSLHDPSKGYSAKTPVPSANIRKATMGDLVKLYEKALVGWE
jgi:alcohol dehydrogenase class IV